MFEYINHVDDTICSLITTPGISGVSVIRISGSNAEQILRKISFNLPKVLNGHKCYFTKLIEPTTGSLLDEVLITFFEKGKSFTGDEVIEISCHGGNLIWKKILDLLINLGCRLANKGEFTFRAFFNGKIDLIQAEAIHNAIKSDSEKMHEISVSQLSGKLSLEIEEHESNIISILANLEASIDFSTEDINPASYSELVVGVSNSLDFFKILLASFSVGSKVKNGNKIIILGPPNVGKSSLFNALLNKERSIVTEIPGTTRDLVSAELNTSGGYILELLDTAGLRSTDDLVEKLGISKASDALQFSDLVILVFSAQDISEESFNYFFKILNLKKQKVLVVLNKVDLLPSEYEPPKFLLDYETSGVVLTSTVEKKNINSLKNKINETIEFSAEITNSAIMERRQADLIDNIVSGLESAQKMLKKEESPDIVSQEIQVVLSKIQMLLGKVYDDQIVDKIFSKFCLGK